MSTNESPTQAHSLSFQEDLGEWAWLHQTTTSDMSQFPIVPPSPTHQAFDPESPPAVVPPPLAPQGAPLYPTMSTNSANSLGSSPVEPLIQEIDPVMAFQLGLYLGSMDPSWAVPESCTPAGLFNNTLDEDMFSGLDFAPETYTYTPPHGSASPATSLYDTDALYLSSNHYAPVDPLTPISLSSGTPESALSPASPAAIFSQTFPYHECSHHNNPNPPAASPSAGSTTTTTTTTTPNPNDTNPPNKPSRKPPHDKNKHLRFRCPVTPATTARCAKGFLDARTLHRHIWTHHKAYARANDVPSEETRCSYPGCGYTGRGDNVARHMKRHAR